MQADNDNLDNRVEGFDEWEPLHEAARKVVEACALERAADHQLGLREIGRGIENERDHEHTRTSCVRLVSSR